MYRSTARLHARPLDAGRSRDSWSRCVVGCGMESSNWYHAVLYHRTDYSIPPQMTILSRLSHTLTHSHHVKPTDPPRPNTTRRCPTRTRYHQLRLLSCAQVLVGMVDLDVFLPHPRSPHVWIPRQAGRQAGRKVVRHAGTQLGRQEVHVYTTVECI